MAKKKHGTCNNNRISKLNAKLEKYPYVFQFLIAVITVFVTIIISFLSAYYGYKLNDNQSKSLEKEKVVKLLYIAMDELRRNEDSLQFIPGDLKTEGIPDMAHAYIQLNPIKNVEKFPIVINSDLVMKWVSTSAYSKIIIAENNLKMWANAINASDKSDKKLRFMLEMYKKELDYTQKIIKAEVDLLKGEIKELEANALQEQYVKEVILFQEESTRRIYGEIDLSKAKKLEDINFDVVSSKKRSMNP